MSKTYPKRVRINVRQADIDFGVGCNAKKCMLHIAGRRAIYKWAPHGYVKVDATGMSITRQPVGGYREKAGIPHWVYKLLYQHDVEKKQGLPCTVKPFSFTAVFRPTSKIAEKATPSRKAQINKARKARAMNGKPDKTYKEQRYRLAGVAL